MQPQHSILLTTAVGHYLLLLNHVSDLSDVSDVSFSYVLGFIIEQTKTAYCPNRVYCVTHGSNYGL